MTTRALVRSTIAAAAFAAAALALTAPAQAITTQELMDFCSKPGEDVTIQREICQAYLTGAHEMHKAMVEEGAPPKYCVPEGTNPTVSQLQMYFQDYTYEKRDLRKQAPYGIWKALEDKYPC